MLLQCLQHVAERVAAAQDQHMVPEAVAPLAFAIRLRDVGKDVGEHRDHQGAQDQDAAQRDDQAEDVVRLMVDREIARIQIKGENVRPVQSPDPPDEAENAIQHEHEHGQPGKLFSLPDGEQAVNFASQHRIHIVR